MMYSKTTTEILRAKYQTKLASNKVDSKLCIDYFTPETYNCSGYVIKANRKLLANPTENY